MSVLILCLIRSIAYFQCINGYKKPFLQVKMYAFINRASKKGKGRNVLQYTGRHIVVHLVH